MPSLEGYLAEYFSHRIDSRKLECEVNEDMKAYEEKENSYRLKTQESDDDGFITVSSGKPFSKELRMPMPLSSFNGEKSLVPNVGSNFYSHGKKTESSRSQQILEIKRKFEQDKIIISQLDNVKRSNPLPLP